MPAYPDNRDIGAALMAGINKAVGSAVDEAIEEAAERIKQFAVIKMKSKATEIVAELMSNYSMEFKGQELRFIVRDEVKR